MSKIKVTLMKSTIGKTQGVKDTVAALGLTKIRTFNVLENTPAIQGMIKKVGYLLKVEDAE
ncbi:MAG: 50S ribosomal protein L30 [Clostridia bacterium]|nr:50S ribosomal protein L30 [Clostridia bacterium]MBO7736550.1 50S ribosomal protein L30 [Clostridia bacterium]MBR7099550.1 50S ribosomal protein L30 [Clostridia bacterium]